MRWVENLYLLPEANSPMTKSNQADLATALLIHYSFDLSGHSATELIHRWQSQYPIDWLHLAVIEALYQGRYKGISVQQILAFWQRRGQIIYHFNMEFQRLICSKFPQSLTELAAPVLPAAKKQILFEKLTNSPTLPPAKVVNGHEPSQAKTPPLLKAQDSEAFILEEVQQGETILATSTVSVMDSEIKPRLNPPEMLPNNSPLKSEKQTKLLPPAVNHPPIGQFMPKTGDRSDSFTSKLKAMSSDNP